MGRLFDLHSGYVYSIALSILKDAEKAEDVLQEIFMQIWRTPSDFNMIGINLCGCLALITRNRSIEFLRNRRPSDFDEELMNYLVEEESEAVTPSTMGAHARSALLQLESREQTTLAMAFFGGCTHMEIAEMTGQRPESVKTMISKSLLALRKHDHQQT